ncbi:MAG: hypothetical protein H6818_00400 [Phycisphaerales bacterium]|nr:hypothetical protein [Phycisphaerales bacterium]
MIDILIGSTVLIAVAWNHGAYILAKREAGEAKRPIGYPWSGLMLSIVGLVLIWKGATGDTALLPPWVMVPLAVTGIGTIVSFVRERRRKGQPN